MALYEGAYCEYRLKNLENALGLLEQLRARYTEGEKGYGEEQRMARAKGELLCGDILADQEKFAEARERFAEARNWGRDTEIGLQALGRQGEMCMALAEGDPTMLDKADICFRTIMESENVPESMLDMTKYRQAKCLERRGKMEEALDKYLEVCVAYGADVARGHVRDWIYYVRSVYDAARLYELKGGRENLLKAARLYRRLGQMGLPPSADAKARAEEIYKTHEETAEK
jgi:hypothetical protein